jgi:hypothetical protein
MSPERNMLHEATNVGTAQNHESTEVEDAK